MALRTQPKREQERRYFVGTHRRSLEEHFRVVIPKAWLDVFGDDTEAVLVREEGRVLRVWPRRTWDIRADTLAARQLEAMDGPPPQREFFENSYEVSIGKQGRFVIPPKERRRGGFEGTKFIEVRGGGLTFSIEAVCGEVTEGDSAEEGGEV